MRRWLTFSLTFIVLKGKKEDILVLRYNTPLNELTLSQVLEFALSKVGSLYGRLEAAKTKLPFKRNPNKQFCSKLIAEAYQIAGLKISEKGEYCTPNDFLQSKILNIVENAIVEASEDDIEVSKKPDLPSLLSKETYKWLRKTYKYAKKEYNCILNTQEQVSEFILAHPESSEAVTKFLLETEFTTFYLRDKVANPYRYNSTEFTELIRKNKEKAIAKIVNDLYMFSANKLQKQEEFLWVCQFVELNSKDLYHNEMCKFLINYVSNCNTILAFLKAESTKNKIIDEVLINFKVYVDILYST